MAGLTGLDFETYGAVSLPEHGLHRYVSDKSFMPLIASCAWMGTTGGILRHRLDLTSMSVGQARRELMDLIGSHQIVAHNAPFEEMVLSWMGLDYPASRFIDSAVVARAAGAGPRLEAAAPQLLNVDKVAAGKDLMRLFSIPGEYQEKSGSPLFDPQVIDDNLDKWLEYGDYCDVDAELGLRIVDEYLHRCTSAEREYQAITMEMNRLGWPVDIAMVEEMQRRYLENQETALFEFRLRHDAVDLNLNSLKQMKEWCAHRGIKATSFDEKHVTSLLKRLNKKLEELTLSEEKIKNYSEVVDLLETKQVLGGSSLKKLKVILDTAVEWPWDGPGSYRLKDQYLHCGAGQTLRTTGRSTQMQNLKQMGVVADMAELLEDTYVQWDNGKLAENIRQVFTSSDKGGRLIVGDFKSVESRGLAYMAGEEWKLQAYRDGRDVYSELASKIYVMDYDMVLPKERQTGKVGELACGYGAGGEAVQAFAANMGVEMSEGEATKLVWDWRQADPMTVLLWARLNEMLQSVVLVSSFERIALANGLRLEMKRIETPLSLLGQDPNVQSISMELYDSNGRIVLMRYFHGCYSKGRNICYYKPSERKTGDLWKSGYTDPKTGRWRDYELYGGKLAGILTQSFCREIFFRVLVQVKAFVQQYSGQLGLVGQFHDEIVVDWKPGALGLATAKAALERIMSDAGSMHGFPLGADIKSAYRYVK
jgi:DNA polymerase